MQDLPPPCSACSLPSKTTFKLPCSHPICLKCLQNSATPGFFVCPKDSKKFKNPISKVDSVIQSTSNTSEESLGGNGGERKKFGVFCSSHVNEPILYKIRKDRKYLCAICIQKSNKLANVENSGKNNILEELELIEEKIVKLKMKTEHFLKNLQQIKGNIINFLHLNAKLHLLFLHLILLHSKY